MLHQFNKEGGKVVEDCKLRVVYVFPHSGSTNGEDGIKDSSNVSSISSLYVGIVVSYVVICLEII